MSPENQGVFPAPEGGDFAKNSGIPQLVKKGLFWGAFMRGLVYSCSAGVIDPIDLSYLKNQILKNMYMIITTFGQWLINL